MGAAAERLRRGRRVNHNSRVADYLGTPRRRPGRRVAQGHNLQRRVAFLVLVPPSVRVKGVRERLGRGRQVFLADNNNRSNRRRRVGYSETPGAALPHHSQAVYSGVGQRSSSLRLAVDYSAALRELLNNSNLRQAVDFLGVPPLSNSPLRAVGYLEVLQPNSNLRQAADCLVVPPNNNRPRVADYLEVLQVNNNNNNPLREVDCLGVLLNSSLLRAVGYLEAQPRSSRPQAVVGASLLPLQHSLPNNLDRALFLVRQQRRAQVCLGASAQEH